MISPRYVLCSLLVLLPCVAFGHNGRLAVAPATPGIVVDGDVSEWPEHFPRYPVSQLAFGAPASDEADLSATFRVAYDETANRLFVAVEVVDESYVDNGPGNIPNWERADGCELFLDPSHGQHPAIQLAAWGVTRHALGGLHASTVQYDVEVVTAPGRRTYEWSIDAATLGSGLQLTSGAEIAFDVAVGDRDEDGSFSWLSWGPHTSKLEGRDRLGDLLLGGGQGALGETLTHVGELIGRAQRQAAADAQQNAALFSFLGGALVAVTLLHLLLFWFQRESRVNLYHALFAGSTGVAIATAWVLPSGGMQDLSSRYILGLWLGVIYAVSLLLLYSQFHGGVTRTGKLLLLWLVLGELLRVWLPEGWPVDSPQARWLWLLWAFAQSSLVAAFLTIGALVLGAVFRRREGAWTVGVSFLVFAACAGLVVYYLIEGRSVQPWLLAGILLPLAAMSYRLARSVAWVQHDLARRYEEVEQLSARLAEQNRSLELANIKIRESSRQVEEANRLKSAFLAHMSHDLRTPLNAIIGYTRILLRRLQGEIDERQYRNLDNIRVSAGNLLALINDILDLSRIESGRTEVQLDDVDVRTIARECVATMEALVPDGVELRSELLDVPPIQTDGDRVRRVTMNLLGNAVKFTEAGAVTVRLHPFEQGVELTVSDTGIGIPASDLAHVFDEFRQVERKDKKREGSGLGLAIARRSIEMLGGTIHADSVVGEGSTFTVRLPARVPEEEVEPTPAA